MTEFIDYIPNIIRSAELTDVPVDQSLAKRTRDLMTPEEILKETEFENPAIILPDRYPNFDFLLKAREKIRTLKLLPIKTQQEYDRYHQQPKELLIHQVEEYLGDSPMALAPNVFPFFLPDDLEQSLIWIKGPDTNRYEIAEFIGKLMQLFKLSDEEVILYERSLSTNTKIVKGSFPEFKHIHFWTKMKDLCI